MSNIVGSQSGARLTAVLMANALLRIASSAGGALIGFYLAQLALRGGAVDAGLVGALGVAINIAELGAAIPIGVLADRLSPRVLLVGGAALGAVATQLFTLQEAVLFFFLARILQGIATATGGPALLAYLTDLTADSAMRRGRVMALYELSLLVGLALGGLVGGGLWDGFGRVAFSLLAAIYLMIAGLFLWGVRGQGRGLGDQEHPLAGLRQALRDPLLVRLAPVWLAMNAIIGMWLTHVSFQLNGPQVAGQYLNGRFSASQVGLVLLVFAVVFAIGVLGWGFVLGKMPRVRVLRIAMLAMGSVCIWLYLLNTLENAAPWLRWLLVVCTCISVMIESGFTPTALAYLADVAGENGRRGATMGIYTLLLGLGSGIGAAVGGVLAERFAFNGLLLGTVGLLAVGWVALSLLSASE